MQRGGNMDLLHCRTCFGDFDIIWWNWWNSHVWLCYQWKIFQAVPGVDVMDQPTQYSQRSKILKTRFEENHFNFFCATVTSIPDSGWCSFIRWASTWIGWQNSLEWSTYLKRQKWSTYFEWTMNICSDSSVWFAKVTYLGDLIWSLKLTKQKDVHQRLVNYGPYNLVSQESQ